MIKAFCIVQHPHLNIQDLPLIVNIGGEYIYNVEKSDKGFIINRDPNPEYIPLFFDSVDNNGCLNNISAIVGENGAGKTSILNFILELMRYSNPSFGFVIGEDEEGVPIILGQHTLNIFFKNKQIDSYNEVFKIYYSPFLNYVNHSENNFHAKFANLSFDSVLLRDLDSFLEFKGNSDANQYDIFQHLSNRNHERNTKSSLGKIFSSKKNKLRMPSLGESSLHLSSINEIKLWNTPYEFRPFVELFNTRYEELLALNQKRLGKAKNKYPVNLEFFKIRIMNELKKILVLQMEKSNSYLQEGYLLKDFVKRNRNKSLDSILLNFTKEHFFKYQKSEKWTYFNYSLFKNFIDVVYKSLDSINPKKRQRNREVDFSSLSYIPDEMYSRELLKVQNQLCRHIEGYYTMGENEAGFNAREMGEISGVFSFSNVDRKLSSGEQAYYNLYSRIGHFLETKIIRKKYNEIGEPTNYILLLDEADLGYHPQWKKEFVEDLTLNIPKLFSNVSENKVNIQIIFTSHDPITLSDMPSRNVVLIEKNGDNIRIFNPDSNQEQTFGANVSTLLEDSFFIKDGLMGSFAKRKINETIKWLLIKDKRRIKKGEKDKYWRLINSIGEPIIRRKLKSMYVERFNDSDTLKLLYEEKERIENEIERREK